VGSLGSVTGVPLPRWFLQFCFPSGCDCNFGCSTVFSLFFDGRRADRYWSLSLISVRGWVVVYGSPGYGPSICGGGGL
ncbi:hypothetical protein A2U01_0049027, partial [Trifolium medium]|nr:hypothetical protein [Trifolium medium]